MSTPKLTLTSSEGLVRLPLSLEEFGDQAGRLIALRALNSPQFLDELKKIMSQCFTCQTLGLIAGRSGLDEGIGDPTGPSGVENCTVCPACDNSDDSRSERTNLRV